MLKNICASISFICLSLALGGMIEVISEDQIIWYKLITFRLLVAGAVFGGIRVALDMSRQDWRQIFSWRRHNRRHA